MTNYNSIREKLDTGDLILFSGSSFFSKAIQWTTKSEWSHIGMVIRIPELDVALLFQSTVFSKVKDAISDTFKQGVQITILSENVNVYPGKIACRYLSVERTPEFYQSLKDFRKEMKNRPYEEGKFELIKAAYDGPFGENTEDLSSLFCSELIAEAYQRMGLLSENIPSNEYTPADFSSTNKNLNLMLNAKLSEEIIIKE